MKIMLSKILGLAMLAGMGTGLQGCTDEDVATGVGLVAIGAGLVIIGDSDRGHGHGHGHRRRRCEGGHVRRCTSYRDYWGHYHRDCRSEWDSCARYSHYSNDEVALFAEHLSNNSEETVLTAADTKQTVSRGKWAAKFEMSFKSADFMLTSLEQAREGKPQALLDLGLERKDVELLANEKMPSAKGIDTLARKLNMDSQKTEAMIQSLLEEGKELNKKKCRRIGPPGRGHIVCRAS